MFCRYLLSSRFENVLPLSAPQLFAIEAMQLRNAFDARGPLVPGIPPAEAVSRLRDFQGLYDEASRRRATIDSVSRMYSVPRRELPELDRMGQVGARRRLSLRVKYKSNSCSRDCCLHDSSFCMIVPCVNVPCMIVSGIMVPCMIVSVIIVPCMMVSLV